jgi:uncharacterized protein (TIGR02466 family)
MSNDFQVIPLFSTPLFVGHIDIDLNLILDSISNLKYLESFAPGKGSENEKILELKELSILKNEVDKAFEIYLHQVLMYEKSSSFGFIHESSWANLHHKNDYSPVHAHQNSMYSFVFYVDVDEDSGDIIFSLGGNSTFSYDAFDIPISSYNVYNSKQWIITPKNGMILIFPSHLPHCVTQNKSDKFRYSISGNYYCRGKIVRRTVGIKF